MPTLTFALLARCRMSSGRPAKRARCGSDTEDSDFGDVSLAGVGADVFERDIYANRTVKEGFGQLVQLSTPSRTGTFRLLSFNCNGIQGRSRDKYFWPWLHAATKPGDLVLLQEIKVGAVGRALELIRPTGFKVLGITVPSDNSSKGVATLLRQGVAGNKICSGCSRDDGKTLSSESAANISASALSAASLPVLLVHADLPPSLIPPAMRAEFAGRIVTVWLGEPLWAVIVNVYAPNAGDKFTKAARRAAWDASYLAYARALDSGGGAGLIWPPALLALFASAKPAPVALPFERFAGRVVHMGDFNVTPDLARDIWPSVWRRAPLRVAGTSVAERAGFVALLAGARLHDVWRERNGRAIGATYYSAAHHGSRGAELAARFDNALVATALRPLVDDARLLDDGAPRGDHLPLSLDLTIPAATRADGGGGCTSSGVEGAAVCP